MYIYCIYIICEYKLSVIIEVYWTYDIPFLGANDQRIKTSNIPRLQAPMAEERRSVARLFQRHRFAPPLVEAQELLLCV